MRRMISFGKAVSTFPGLAPARHTPRPLTGGCVNFGTEVQLDRTFRVEAYAIMSADGFIADAQGRFPDVLRNEADQRFFKTALDQSAAIAMGRITHEQEPNAGRRRLVLTRRVAALAPDESDPKALFWNPAGASFEAARLALGLRQGSLAVVGGADVYEVFFAVGYDAFHLSTSHRVRMGAGRPIFPGIGDGDAALNVLKNHGLRAGPLRLIDPAGGVSLVAWSPV
jgi:dihydrofolate reductase